MYGLRSYKSHGCITSQSQDLSNFSSTADKQMQVYLASYRVRILLVLQTCDYYVYTVMYIIKPCYERYKHNNLAPRHKSVMAQA